MFFLQKHNVLKLIVSIRERQKSQLCFLELPLELRYFLVQPYGVCDSVLVNGRYLVLDVLDHYSVLLELYFVEVAIGVEQFVEIIVILIKIYV